MIRTVTGVSKVCVALGASLLTLTLFIATAAEAAPKQQILDNSNKKRVSVQKKWHLNTYNPQKFEKNYLASKPGRKGSVAYKVKTPRSGFYTVCASRLSNKKYNNRTPVRIKAQGGIRVKLINQRRNGGQWNKLGTWKLRKGDNYKISVGRDARGKGWVVADTFKVVKASSPKGVPCRKKPSNSEPTNAGQRVAKAAESYVGTPYYLGGPGDCVPNRRMDCSYLTGMAYKEATNIDNLPDDPAKQWNYGRKVSSLQPGDIVFYREGGGSISHAGIYSGNNEIIHASDYFGRVVKSGMRWLGDGYVGARRLV